MGKKNTLSFKHDLEARETYLKTLRENGYNVSATARQLGITRSPVKYFIQVAITEGWLTSEDLDHLGTARSNLPTIAEIDQARRIKLEEFARKEKEGTWRKAKNISLPFSTFILKPFGDPHIDDPGFDLLTWEKHIEQLNSEEGIYGLAIGDWFNNWKRQFAALWKEGGNPEQSWILFEDWMSQYGDDFLAACSGNHDDWTQAPKDPIHSTMEQYDILYRRGAIRLSLSGPTGEPLSVALRHKWRGKSIYSAAHGILRGVSSGWKDDLAIGGHTHQDEPRIYVDPETGEISHLLQLSTFKKYDVWVDTEGFIGPKIEPCLSVLVDLEKKKTEPERVKFFWDHEEALELMKWKRNRA